LCDILKPLHLLSNLFPSVSVEAWFKAASVEKESVRIRISSHLQAHGVLSP